DWADSASSNANKPAAAMPLPLGAMSHGSGRPSTPKISVVTFSPSVGGAKLLGKSQLMLAESLLGHRHGHDGRQPRLLHEMNREGLHRVAPGTSGGPGTPVAPVRLVGADRTGFGTGGVEFEAQAALAEPAGQSPH